MKAQKSKIFLTIALTAIVVLTAVFAFSSCSTEHVHTFEENVVKEATCTLAGKIIKTCTDEACDYSEELTVDSKGHSIIKVSAQLPSCTEIGYVGHQKCIKCDWTTLDASGIQAPLGHNISDKIVDDRQKKSPEYDIQYPTCTESGYHYEYKECSECKNNFDAVIVVDAPLGHDISVVKARAASCNIGWDTYEYCNGWTKSELYAKGYPYYENPIAASGPALGDAGCGYNTYVEHPAIYDHVLSSNYEYVEVEAATCETPGRYKFVRKCTTCPPKSGTWPNGSQFTPYFEEMANSEDYIIAALGHEWQTHKGQDATCTTDGWKDFVMCSRCSKVDTPDGMIPVIPSGHQPSSNGCLLVCGICGYIDIDSEQGGHKIITKVTDLVEPTCVDPGSYTCIKSCVKCDQEITKEVVRIDPHGHDYIEHVAAKPTCTTVGWDAFKSCSRCAYTEFKEIPALGHTPSSTAVVINKKDATCTEEGFCQYVYYCTSCNDVAERHRDDYPVVPHTVVKVDAKPATCVDKGHSAYEYCSVCNRTLSSKYIYEATGHSIYYEDAKEPSCTEAGYFAYAVCKVCGYNNKAASVIPARGHDIQTVAAKAPTCTEEGWKEHTACTREGCDLTTKPSNILPVTGHTSGVETVVVTKAVTCTTNGTYDVVLNCTVCGVEIERKVGLVTVALGHNYLANGYCERYNACGDRISAGLAYYKNADGTYTVAGRGSCADADIIIPNEYNGAKVVAIAEGAFSDDKNLISIKIGNNVTEIGQKAFYYCRSLKTVTIGASVTKVGANAFRYCSAITKTYYTGSNWGAIDFTTWNDDLTSKY